MQLVLEQILVYHYSYECCSGHTHTHLLGTHTHMLGLATEALTPKGGTAWDSEVVCMYVGALIGVELPSIPSFMLRPYILRTFGVR